MILEPPWEPVENLMPGLHRTFRRGSMTVSIEDPDGLTPHDWQISISMEGRRPLDSEVAVVLAQLGITNADEIPSVVNPFVRHFFGSH